MKFSLTRLFIERPTLVFVIVSLMMFAGILSTATIVKELYPDVSQPTVTIQVQYSGASVTEMRDNIVQPIEQNLAGTADLQTFNSVVQQGQASISAIFDINSDTATDLALTNKAIQAAEKYLPTNLTPPTVNLYDPTQSTVVTLALYSQKLSLSRLALYAINVIAPQLEQVPGISFANVGGIVTPAYEVVVDPARLAAANLTLNDVIATLQADNQRVPGGFAYEPNRQTTIDIRGDIQNLDSVRNLAIMPASGTSSSSTANSTGAQVESYGGGTSALPGVVDPWTATNSVVRVGDVATVTEGYEPRLQYAHISGTPGLFLQVQKAATGSEVDASNNVLRALPQIERQFPEIKFRVIHVQSTFTKQQINIVTRTLMLAILLTGIAMIFFLRSWRSAIVVCVSIPTSLAIAITVMKAMHLTIDTISLLGMSLVIGILVDDSTVVLENIERHFTELKQPPEEAAVKGREEIGAAAVVITLVDVVVFLPIAFIQGQVGRQIAEFAIVVVISTLTSLFVSFTITPTLAGLWALRSHWKPWRVVDWFGAKFDDLRAWYTQRALSWSLGHGRLVALFCAGTFGLALAMVARRRRRRGVHSARRPRRDLHPAHVSHRHADPDRRERHVRSRATDPQHARYVCEYCSSRSVRGPLWGLRFAEQRRPSARLVERRPEAPDDLLVGTVPNDRQKVPPARRDRRRRPLNGHLGRKRTADRLSRYRRNRRRSDCLRPASAWPARESAGRNECQQHGYPTRPGDFDSIRSQQSASIGRGPRGGRAGGGRCLWRERCDPVRDDRRFGAGAGHLSGIVSNESGRFEIGCRCARRAAASST